MLIFIITIFAELIQTHIILPNLNIRYDSIMYIQFPPCGKSRRWPPVREDKTEMWAQFWVARTLHPIFYLEPHYSVVIFCFLATMVFHIKRILHIWQLYSV
jgi:hypothetical protein